MIHEMNSLILKDKCPTAAFARNLYVGDNKNDNYEITLLTKEVIKMGYINKEYIYKRLDEIIPFKKQVQAQANNLIRKLNRYFQWLENAGLEQIGAFSSVINYHHHKIFVGVDMVLKYKNTNHYIFARFKSGKPELSSMSYIPENRPENNLELLLMQLLIQEKGVIQFGYDSIYIPALIHLDSKKDRNGVLEPYFEATRESNIVYGVNPMSYGQMAYESLNRALIPHNTLNEAAISNHNECTICQPGSLCQMEATRSLHEKEEGSAVNSKHPLTDQQQRVVDFKNGVCRVNAGAGTGKTTVIVNRIEKLIHQGNAPEDIMLITFTNKAAREMKDRIQKLMDYSDEDMERFNIKTFNAFGNDYIVDNYKYLGFLEPPRLLTDLDRYQIIMDILDRRDHIPGLDYRNPTMNFRYAKGAIMRVNQMFYMIEDLNINNHQEFHAKFPDLDFYNMEEKEAYYNGSDLIIHVLSMYKEYKEEVGRRNLISYDDQLGILLNMIYSNDETLNNYHYSHIFVDEFQDTNEDQLDIVVYWLMQSKFKSLMVVGDDAQSIFGFRGSKPEIMINLKSKLEEKLQREVEVTDINITQNFRSTIPIVELANRTNNRNINKITGKDLVSNKIGPEPVLLSYPFERFIQETGILRNSDEYKETAIIARTNKELAEIKAILDSMNIPAVIDVAAPVIKNENVLLFIKLVKFINNIDIDEGLVLFLSLYRDIFKNLKLEDAKAYISDYKEELVIEYKIGEDLRFNSYLPEEEKQYAYKKRFELLKEFVSEISDDELTAFFEEIMEEFTSPYDLERYLAAMVKYNDNRAVDIDRNKYDAVTLTTAHSSKGREFKRVILESSKFKPNSNKTKHIEEERRLLFTAITRAKEELYILNRGGYFFKELKEDIG